jgi:hypothetical protein
VYRWATAQNEYVNVPKTVGEEQLPGVASGLGAGSTVQLEIHVPLPNPDTEPGFGSPGFIMRMTYQDVAGKKWITETTWLAFQDRYTDSKVRSG